MELDRWQALLEQARDIMPAESEKSIFSTAGRGYFENPTTDLLAFFLDPLQEHGLGDCFLRGLLSCLPDTEGLSLGLVKPPRREVVTHAGNRIDLLVEGDGWALVLENKIFNSQVNPFDDYEAYARKEFTQGQKLIFAVLSPDGVCVNSNWSGIGYTRLINETRQQLGQLMVTQPMDKWHFFARDFLLHLENITVEQNMDDSVGAFVWENLPEIKKLVSLKNQAINALDNRVVAQLEAEVAGYQRYTRRHTWEGGPALRYASNNWKTWSDVVLYLDASGDLLKPHIRVYLCEMSEALVEQARKLFQGYSDSWFEQRNTILVFGWRLDSYGEEKILQLIADNMKLLMEFETCKRIY